MTDTRELPPRIKPDKPLGPHMRLTDAALEHAKTRLGTHSIEELSHRLGLANRMVLWRVRHGRYDIRLGQALAISEQLDWPLSKVFEGPDHA